MNYRRLGKTGLKVSELSLGSWVTYGGQVGDEATRGCMVAAYEAGVNFFDGAEVYSKGEAERSMGRVLKDVAWRRESLVLSTKIFWGGDGPNDKGLSHKRVMEGFHGALKRWQVDYLDLAFCHCSSFFECKKTGQDRPEVDAYKWIAIDAIPDHCGKYLTKLLFERLNLATAPEQLIPEMA